MITLQESGEMYLETILRLSQEKKIVRSIDVAQAMGFSKPSVSRAMKTLSENGYLTMDHENGSITLLEPGIEVAKTIYERHRYITRFFIHLGVSPETAEEDACRIEHVISAETFGVLKNKMDEVIAEESKADSGASAN